jgi:hypothetical protein
MSCPENVQGADEIGIVFEATSHTLEFGPRRTVGFVGLPALRARQTNRLHKTIVRFSLLGDPGNGAIYVFGKILEFKPAYPFYRGA